ncbi:MAG: LamG domain-containing protein [Phycisphaerae bacterium]|nr:LamG domain-containing protein [Phycisphaerae bacterium]
MPRQSGTCFAVLTFSAAMLVLAGRASADPLARAATSAAERVRTAAQAGIHQRQTMLWDRAPVQTQPNGLPILHSCPGAPVSIFLDFQFKSVSDPTTVFSQDGDLETFSEEEQEVIRMAWAKAASAFAPFHVDVTTVEPDPAHPYIWEAILRQGGGGSAGTTGYVPLAGQKKATNGSQRADGYRWCARCGGRTVLAGVIVHEAGHAQGISGHEAYDEEGNYIGIQNAGIERGPFTRSVGPIGAWHVWLSEWGKPQKNPAGLFWVVNDIERITGEVVRGAKTYTDPNYAGDGFRPDDHGNDIGHATKMVRGPVPGLWAGAGIIERYTDKDVLEFEWSGGPAWIAVQTNVPVPLLDVRATLTNAKGAIVAAADPAESMQAAMRVDDLPAGTYYLEVSSDGDYGELGRYEATVSAALPLALEPIAHLSFEGELLTDLSGEGHHGTWSGAAMWTDGPDGSSAARFDGTNQVVISSNGRGFVSPGQSPLGCTIACWFRTGDVSADGEHVFLQSPGKAGYKLYVADNKLHARAVNDAGLSNWRGGTTLSAHVALQPGQWYHAALTHRTTFSEVGDTIALYLDGREMARGPAGPVPDASQFVAGGPTFVGGVDEVRIFNEVVPTHLIGEFAHRGELSQRRPVAGGIDLQAAATHDSVTLHWDALAGAKGYEILRSGDNQHFALLEKVPAGTATFTDVSLEASRQYFYGVRAEGEQAMGVVDVTTRSGPVYKPRFIRVKKADDLPSEWGYHRYGHQCEGVYGITLLWFGPYGHRDRSIRIERSTDGKNFIPIITLPSIERVYYDTNLMPGTKYTYRFVTIDDAGEAAAAVITATSASP